MPRVYWKGYLKLSLVSCPVELYPATSQAEKTHFHLINTKTGNRLRQKMVDEETGREVDPEHKGRGYEISKGRYVQSVTVKDSAGICRCICALDMVSAKAGTLRTARAIAT